MKLVNKDISQKTFGVTRTAETCVRITAMK